jgi:hypothetical protein
MSRQRNTRAGVALLAAVGVAVGTKLAIAGWHKDCVQVIGRVRAGATPVPAQVLCHNTSPLWIGVALAAVAIVLGVAAFIALSRSMSSQRTS